MPYRYACDVLDELRKCYETRNFAYYMGSVEELQNMYNRMEAKLREYKSAKEQDEYVKRVEKDVTEKRAELAKITQQLDQKRTELKKLDDDVKNLRHTWLKETKGGTLLTQVQAGEQKQWACCQNDADDLPCTPECVTGRRHSNSPCCNRNADMQPCDCPKT